MVDYKICTNVDDYFIAWLDAQPNLVKRDIQSGNFVTARFNHDATQQSNFMKLLAQKGVMVYGENVNKYDTDLYSPTNPPPQSGQTVAVAREEVVASWNASITKTNLAITFQDVYNQANADGKSIQIDTNGKTEVKLQVLWNKVGTGTQTVQVLEVGTANVLISMNVVSGRNVSALTPIPAFATNSVKFYKLQCKTTLATDDPIFEGARVYLK